jgi:hypothetical protein
MSGNRITTIRRFSPHYQPSGYRFSTGIGKAIAIFPPFDHIF